MFNLRSILLFFKRLGTKNKRNLLLKKIKTGNFPEKEVFVSVEDFFDGNEDEGSIGANIFPNPPSLNEFYNTLKDIEKKPQTENILIKICDIDDCDWFHTDTVYISGIYSLAEIKVMFKHLKPDEVYKGKISDKPSNIPELKSNSSEYNVWWD